MKIVNHLLSKFWKKSASFSCSVVIVAAGNATRMGCNKILLPLNGIPVLVYTMQAFQNVEAIREIIVVTQESDITPVWGLCRDFHISKVKRIIRGGDSRSQSSYLGIMETDPTADLIAIHDGARPLITADIIQNTLEAAAKYHAAAPAVAVKDTIKRVENGMITATVDRSELFAVQTPQVFDAALIKAALKKAFDNGEELTDDCMAVENLGGQVKLTDGSYDNIKLTTFSDVIVAETILRGRRERDENRTWI